MAGVEWLVPSEDVYHCCPTGKKSLVPGPAQTPVALKQAIAAPVPLPVGLAIEACPTPPVTCVPGAMISGLMRPSAVGPRLEKLMTSLALSAPASPMPQASVPPSD